MTMENDDSIFKEPNFTNNDLNAFLKSDKLGRGSQEAPKLHNLISLNRLLMRKSIAGQKPSRDVIVETIK
jgi:hypothetical protein